MTRASVAAAHERRAPGGQAVLQSLWFAMVLCGIVFFVCNHHLSEPMRVDADIDTAVNAIGEGSLSRQVSLTLLGAYGTLLLVRARRWTAPGVGVLTVLVFAFLAWACLSVTWCDDPAFTIRKVLALVMLGVGAWGIGRWFSVEELAWLVVVTSLVYLVFGIGLEAVDGTLTPLDAAYRFGGTLHPNHQAMNCGLMALASFYLARRSPRARRTLVAIGLAGLAFLVLTKSRTGLASTVASLVAYWLLVSSRRARLAGLTAAVVAGLLAVALLVGARARLSEDTLLMGRTDAEMETLSGRTELWDWTADLLENRELTGYGFNSFWTPQRVEDISEEQHWTITQGHSSYLDMLLGVGFIGLGLYVALLVAGIVQAVRLHRATHDARYAFLCALLAFTVVEGTVESALLYATTLAFLTIVAFSVLSAARVTTAARLRAGRRWHASPAPWNRLPALPGIRPLPSHE